MSLAWATSRAPSTSRLGRSGRRRPSRAWLRAAAPRLVASSVPCATAVGLRTEKIRFTGTFVAVVTVNSIVTGQRFVVKLPYTGGGLESLRRQAGVLSALHTDPRLLGWSPVAPLPVGHGEIGGCRYWIEQLLPGEPVTRGLLRRGGLLRPAAELIGDFHDRTGEWRALDDAWVEARVERPLRRIRDFYATRGSPAAVLGALDRLGGELVPALLGRTARTCWIHGDFWPGNLLAADGTVTGVVDWDQAQLDQLRLHDLVQLHLFARWLATGEELGPIVVRCVHNGLPSEIGLPAQEVAAWLDGVPDRTAVLLYWLRHVSLFINSEGHRDNRRWLRHNVERVLARVW